MLLGLIALFTAAATGLTCLLTDPCRVWLWVLCLVGYFLVGLGLALGFLLIACKRVDRSQPQEQDSPFYRKLAKIYIQMVVQLCRIRVNCQGLEKLPKDRRFLLVCNHLSVADPAMLLHVFPQAQLAFISKKENDRLPIVGDVMHKLQCQLLDRENDRAALKTILECVRILKEDRASLGVFPEGYTARDGLLRRFRPGVFKIVQKTNVPIVICTLRDTATVIPSIKRLKKSTVELHLVDVIEPEAYAGMTTVDMAELVYGKMAADLGPELVYQGE